MVDSVVVELVESVESAKAKGTLAKRIAIPSENAAVFNERCIVRSPLYLQMRSQFHSRAVLNRVARTFSV